MPNSMTGFGRAVQEAPCGRFTVEIQSLNRKYFEIFLSLPKEFSRFEQEMRKWIGEVATRGQVTVKVLFTPHPASLEKLLPDAHFLKKLKESWETIARKVGVDVQQIDLPFLLQYLPVGSTSEEIDEENLPPLRLCVTEALEKWRAMKKKEGQTLVRDLQGRLQTLHNLREEVEKFAPQATGRMKEKLLAKIGEVFQASSELEERLLREVALFAERVDIAEEMTRLKSHFDQFQALFQEEMVGRKMDFLVQEMGREVNTIGSKSLEAKVSHLVVEMKSELEKMREQIQNIE